MSCLNYYGENGNFSFIDNSCEETGRAEIHEFVNLGQILGNLFKRVAIGSNSVLKTSELHLLIGGIVRSGADVFIINEVMPVFRYGIKVTDCECGLYLCGNEKIKIIFFDKYGIALSENEMQKICNYRDKIISYKNGSVSQILHIGELYLNSIKDIIAKNYNGNAVISCSEREITDIWRKFFSSETGDIIFQVSEDGSRVNCYSTELGFISHEKLILAYAIILWKMGKKVILPKNFHYVAEKIANSINGDYDYINDYNHLEVFEQRFIFDALYLCVSLMNIGMSITETVRKLPKFYTAKREIITSLSSKELQKSFAISNGRVNFSKSGKNLVTLTVQAMNMEIASEICGELEKKIKFGSCD